MPDPGANFDCELLPLPDADLLLWRQTDLGEDYAILQQRLIEQIEWRQDRITIFGKSHLQPRLSAWYGDLEYRYSGLRLEPLPWNRELLALKDCVEDLTGASFNSVLLNYYRDGRDSMGMHSDDERELGARPAIASLSLGATRDFVLRHRFRKDLETVKLPLAAGSLLLMRGDTQQYWRHGINKTKRECGARINLTFRRILTPQAEE